MMNQILKEKTRREPSPIDLEALQARCLGNLDLVDRVLARFATQVDADLDDLERAIKAGNAEQAAYLAHRIKGVAGSVEARDLYTDAALAEEVALEKRLADLPDFLRRMRGDRTEVTSCIKRVSRQSNN
jgi:HPt (histidine-containing phosphotransfer) domain-containing protein